MVRFNKRCEFYAESAFIPGYKNYKALFFNHPTLTEEKSNIHMKLIMDATLLLLKVEYQGWKQV